MEFKGDPTDRDFNFGPYNILSIISLKRSELIGRKVLDVGIGGGKGFAQARQMGLDFHGFDTLPLYSPSDIADIAKSDPHLAERVVELQLRLKKIMEKYPGLIKAGDGTVQLPYQDNEFDDV